MKRRFFTLMTTVSLLSTLTTVQGQQMTPAQGAQMMPAQGAQMTPAQSDGIVFSELSFSEALKAAKAENKLLFIDCFTTWCGPCKMLSKEVFTDSLFADYFNQRFVNLKMDMEKGEGPELRKKYNVRAYPTLLFLDANGEEVNRLVGASGAPEMLRKVKKSIESGGLSALQKRYEAGERDSAFVCGYIEILTTANMRKEVSEVTADFLVGKEAEMLESSYYFSLFYSNVRDVTSSAFQYVAKHEKEFCDKYSSCYSPSVDQRMLENWIACSNVYIKVDGAGQSTLDEPGLKAYVAQMKQLKVAEADLIGENVRLRKDGMEQQWSSFVKRAGKLLASKTVLGNDANLLQWANQVNESCADKALREKVAGWCDEACKELRKKDEEVKKNLPPGAIPAISMIDFKSRFLQIAALLRKPMEQK